MGKLNEYIRLSFIDGTLHKSEWVHDECAKPIVTYTYPDTGHGYKYFKNEDLTGTPDAVQVSDLIKEGWEKTYSMKAVDNTDKPVSEGYMEDTTQDTIQERHNAVVALVNRLIQIDQILDDCKPLYEEKDNITLQLRELVGVGNDHSIFLPGTENVVTVVDNFADKNCVFRPAAFRQFEAKVEDREAYAKRLKKAAKA